VRTADAIGSPEVGEADVRVVLRGLAPFAARGRHVLWILSHPEDVDDAELAAADLVACASSRLTAELASHTDVPVVELLQATDPRRFRPCALVPAAAHPVLFVGKTRGTVRPLVDAALAAGLRPALYGEGWEHTVDRSLIRRTHVANEDLPTLYSSAGVVLNDHWDTMRAWGILSNRLFDVVACGAPVVSDPVPGLEDVFGDAVLVAEGPDDLRSQVERVLGDAGTARRRMARGRAGVLAGHTFDHRARTLVDAIRAHIA
jgi:hypothetical protein